MSQPLPRYTDEPDFQAKLARILLDVGEPAPPSTGVTAGGDERRLRGIPAIGRGVAGAVPGTAPHALREVA